MSEFSSTQEVGEPILQCQEGNLFFCGMSADLQSRLGIRGHVNNKNTPALPAQVPYMLRNSPSETINRLDLEVNGCTKPLIDNISDFGIISLASDLRAAVSIPAINAGHNGSDQSMLNNMNQGDTSETGVGAFEIQDTAGLSVGKTEVSDLSNEQKARLGAQLGPIFGVEIDDINEGYSSKPSEIAQSAIGIAEGILKSGSASSVGAATQPAMIRSVAIFEAIIVSEVITIRRLGSSIFLSFETRISYLRLVRESHFVNAGFAIVDAKAETVPSTKSLSLSSAKNVFKGTGGVFLVIGATLNVAEWFSKEPGERFISDIFVDLAVMVATAVVSAIAATALVALGVGTAVVAAGGIAVSVAIGAAALVIGWGITAGWSLISDDVKKFIREIDWYEDVYKGGMTDDEIYEGMMTAP